MTVKYNIIIFSVSQEIYLYKLLSWLILFNICVRKEGGPQVKVSSDYFVRPFVYSCNVSL